MMIVLDLDAITARADAAPSGPWKLAAPRPDGRNLVARDYFDLNNEIRTEWITYDTQPGIAEFIAHAREDVPALVAEVRRLREALTEVAKHQEDMADSLDDHITHEDIHVALIEGMRLAADSREPRS